jgi:hypothetical protein
MILESLVTLFCSQMNLSSSTTQFAPQCNQVLDAASIQSGLKPSIDKEESKYTNKYSNEVTDETGKAPWVIGAFAYTLVYQQRVTISGPLKPFESASINLSQGSSTISFTIKF